MLRGTSWSSSIQQELIEKLWVAILTGDSSKPNELPKEHSVEEKKGNEYYEESTDSDESDDESESDVDFDLSELGAGLPLVDRCDLFSAAKIELSKQSSVQCEEQENQCLNQFKEQDKQSITQFEEQSKQSSIQVEEQDRQCSNQCKNQNKQSLTQFEEQNKQSSTQCEDTSNVCSGNNERSSKKGSSQMEFIFNAVIRGETIQNSSHSMAKKPAKPNSCSNNNSPCSSGAKPKVLENRCPPDVSQTPRPRPNTLDISKSPVKKAHKAPNSPSYPSAEFGVHRQKPVSRSSSLKSTSISATVSARERQSAKLKDSRPCSRPTSAGSSSRPPLSPSSRQAMSLLETDRTHLFDVVRRKRILSDSRLTRDLANGKTFPDKCQRRASVADVSKPCRQWRGSFSVREKKGNVPVKNWHQEHVKVTYNNCSSKINTGLRNKEMCLRNASVSKERADTTNNRISKRSMSHDRPTVDAADIEERNSNLRGSLTNSPRPMSLSNSPKATAKSRDKETRTIFGKSGTQKYNSSQSGTPPNSKIKRQHKSESVKTGTENRVVENHSTNMEVDSPEHLEHLSREEVNTTDSSSQELGVPETSEQAVFGAEFEISRLEDCLKEAILSILQELPQGWILVPEHTTELFSSLTSVIDSFPRPDKASVQILNAILDAHESRPCGKGEIAALNNAHLLLYIGLKLCCYLDGDADNKEDKEKTAKNNKEQRETPLVKNNSNQPTEEREDTEEESNNRKGSESRRTIAQKILSEIQKCEGSFDRLMMCLLLGSRAPGRGSGWYCETDEEDEKVRDLKFVLNHLKQVDGCKVSEVISTPLWSCGSAPVVLAALAENPRIVLVLLQYGAGGSAAHFYRYSKCYTNGVYLAIAYLVRKLESQYTDSSDNGMHEVAEREEEQPIDGAVDAENQVVLQEDPENAENMRCKDKSTQQDLLTLAGHNPTAECLRYLLRAVPRVPNKFLRDQLGNCTTRERGRNVAYLLPHHCCLQPPSLLHLSRDACRQQMRSQDFLPQIIEKLDIPESLKDYLNLTRD